MQEAEKHRRFVEAAIVAKAVLVQVGLQVVTANRMIDTLDSVLYERPKTFDGLRVNITSNVDFFTVPDAPMVVVVLSTSEAVIRRIVIGENEIGWQNVFFNQPVQGVLGDIGSHEGADAAFALDESHNWSFSFPISRASAALHSLLAAIVRFVHFDWLPASAQLRAIFSFVQHGANLLEHAPRGLVGYARLPLNLFRGDAAPRLGHEVDRVEPSGEWSRRLVEDRASGRVNVVAAMIARVRRTAHDAMVLGHGFALLAIDAFWVEAIAKPFKAGRVIRVLALEVFQRVRQHFRLAVVVCHLVTYSQVKSYQMCIPTVKG
jgi:hypothetical protein